ncbi:hypothetical protein [Nocardioides limicola]|uniref:hypothetical protein n=1 Tax=Nocardioides limicola TaxID=2803368 RepID=UPI00193C45A3|nr:hypothetical protein [Nocardioides sp. DJM-14]
MPATRLISPAHTTLSLAFLVAVGASCLLMAAFADGFVRLPLGLGGVAFLSAAVAAVIALALPKRRRDLKQSPDGTIVITSPLPLVTTTILAGAALAAGGLLWGATLFIQPSVLDSPRLMFFAVLIGVAALASLPEWWRLCTGRLHRWQVILGPDDFTYRGYKDDVTIPWERIRGAVTQKRMPAGVRVERKGTKPGVVIPITAFRIPAEQFIDEINKRLR